MGFWQAVIQGRLVRVPSLEPCEVKEKLDQGQDLVLVDVREDNEREICKIEGAIHIPVARIEERMAEVPKDKEAVVYCHSGVRSAFAVDRLVKAGYDKVSNLAGGIDRWAEEIDPGMKRY